MKKTKRVIGADNDRTSKLLQTFYGIFCDHLVLAKDCYHAVMSKIVENTYRCFDISLANQLAVSFTNFDITHVLELASTKWNVERYHPSFGIGGYCIPLAPQYLNEQMEYEDKKSIIFNDILAFNNNSVEMILNLYNENFKISDKIIVMGLSSIPNVGITNCSIGIQVAKQLKKNFKYVYINDPYVDQEVLENETQCETCDLDEAFKNFDIIFVITQHDRYKALRPDLKLKRPCTIIDSFGIWNHFSFDSVVKYYEVGRSIEK